MRRQQRKYTLEQKLDACKKYLDEGMSMQSIGKQLDCSDTVVARWIRKFEHGGVDELAQETRGKASKKGINKRKFSSIEEELQYVKAERDILKKILILQQK